jgi:endonuclease/exonuclease/phosphatase family metal-dependent hydrolase
MTLSSLALLASVTVCTWNGQWFPSGRAEHRAAPEVEAQTIEAAAKMLREGLDKADPSGENDVILCLNEIRGPKTARALCDAIGRTNLAVVAVSGYRRRDRFDQQQDVIATTLPIVGNGWSRWKNAKADTPPRGYAYADIIFEPATTARVYAVHLKSNYGQTTEELARRNRTKRSLAIAQIVEQEKPKRGKRKRPVVVAGDFNADAWKKEFKADDIFKTLEKAGFLNVLSSLEPEMRITFPRRGKFGESTLDYIMVRNLAVDGRPFVLPAGKVSDHNPVFVVLDRPGD